MKKILIYISILLISCILIVYGLMHISGYNKKNSFTRNFKIVDLNLNNVREFENHSVTFISNSNDRAFINSYSDRFEIYLVDFLLKKLDTLKVNVTPSFKRNARNIYHDILGGSLYTANTYGDISIFNGTNVKGYKFSDSRLIIDRFQVLSPQSIVFRTRDFRSKMKNRSLIKLRLSDTLIAEHEFKMKNKINALFANDGVLKYDINSSKIFYMYFYRGEFDCLDTNLNLLYTAKTIDTVKKGQTSIKLFNARNTKGEIITKETQGKPPQFVNVNITTYDQQIYVLSKLKADNETWYDFRNNRTIDVYGIKDGRYLYSFHLPDYNGQKTNKIQVKDNKILAIYKAYLVAFDFKPRN